jgi:hypothetical protein
MGAFMAAITESEGGVLLQPIEEGGFMGGGATVAASRHGREQEGQCPWRGGAEEGRGGARPARGGRRPGAAWAGRPSGRAGHVGREVLDGLGRPAGQGRGSGEAEIANRWDVR